MPSFTQRALIAVLALSGRRGAVSNRRLIEVIWQEQPSVRRVRNLHFHVSKLRTMLRGLEPTRTQARIVTQPSGYRLLLADAELDCEEFGRLVTRARVLVHSDELAEAGAAYREALSLWRGPALADVAGDSRWLEAEASGLDELRLTVIEELADLDLAAGRHGQVLAELATLVGHQPSRERLISQLMLALYRSGRQAEALAAYAKYRRVLRQEFGLDPASDLQKLHRQIFAGEADLNLPTN